MYDPSSPISWTWSDVNTTPSQLTKNKPTGLDCGNVRLDIRNADKSPLDTSIFKFTQTSF